VSQYDDMGGLRMVALPSVRCVVQTIVIETVDAPMSYFICATNMFEAGLALDVTAILFCHSGDSVSRRKSDCFMV
jgi:hypothetical protein